MSMTRELMTSSTIVNRMRLRVPRLLSIIQLWKFGKPQGRRGSVLKVTHHRPRLHSIFHTPDVVSLIQCRPPQSRFNTEL